MIVKDVEQGSDEWKEIRRPLLTASVFKEVITFDGVRKKWKRTSGKAFLDNFADPDPLNEFGGNSSTEHGNEMEPQAVTCYELMKNVQCEQAGFIVHDSGLIGCSPDRLVGEDGGLEIKCPIKRHIHTGRLRTRQIDKTDKPQVYGSLYLTGRKWWDYMSYYKGRKPFVKRTTIEDPDYQAFAEVFEDIYLEFFRDVDELRQLIFG